ncbi:Pycsar system effector family protein [Blastomonas sp.]|uniref:Pycsar system effector family protein n=1 Tax=Blastomonas sp. TaxID=1909299 RepID=UPI0035940BDD
MGDDQSADTPSQVDPGFAVNAVHMIRTTEIMTLQLSQMADQKANILMGATFVVFTLAVGQTTAGTFSLPLTVLATFSFLAALMAVFAVLPSIGGGKAPANPNLLFFGTFSHMDEQDFADQMVAMLRDEESMYRAMSRDIHQNGLVLQHKKYRFLGYAYRLFVVGLILTFLVFAVELALGRALMF